PGAEEGAAEGGEVVPLQLPSDSTDRSQNVWQWILESDRQDKHHKPHSTQGTKKAYGGGAASNQTHTWGGGGASAHLRAHQPAHPFIQDPAMPPPAPAQHPVPAGGSLSQTRGGLRLQTPQTEQTLYIQPPEREVPPYACPEWALPSAVPPQPRSRLRSCCFSPNRRVRLSSLCSSSSSSSLSPPPPLLCSLT
ncbi:unnamed protein product, partial [Oncorhynchus mykiss]